MLSNIDLISTGAFYFYNTEPDMTYQDTILAVKENADKMSIPYKYVSFRDVVGFCVQIWNCYFLGLRSTSMQYVPSCTCIIRV